MYIAYACIHSDKCTFTYECSSKKKVQSSNAYGRVGTVVISISRVLQLYMDCH